MTTANDLLDDARAALAFIRANGVPSHVNDDVTERLVDAFETLDKLLSSKDAVLPTAWSVSQPASDLRRPWINNDKTVPELHVGAWEYDVRVCIGTDNVVEIDKFYGPLVAQPVRVSIEGGSWVIERMVEEEDPQPGTSTWVVCARFPIDGEIPGTVQ